LGKSTDGPVSRMINRWFSHRITRFILNRNIPITPNQVSLGSFLLAVAAGLAFYLGQQAVGGILVEASSIIDGVDGELARARNTASSLGGFIDAMLDRFADAAVICGITLWAYEEWGMPAVVLGLLALLGDIMVSYLHARGEASLGVHPSKIGRVPMFASRDVRLFIVFLLGLVGFAFYSLAIVAAVSLTYVVAKLLDIYFNFKL